jgi:CheY-like chemotaxis protein
MRHTILLADDSPTIQRLVNQTFADTRFDIVTVNNGDAAVRKFDEIEPDVVLADIYMPGKNGYEVCAHIKGHPSLASTPVILLVGAFDAFDEATANQAGATAHITKPFEPRALVELVNSTIPEGTRSRKTATRSPEVVAEVPAVAEVPPTLPAPEPDPIPAAAPIEALSESVSETIAQTPEEIPSVVERIAETAPAVENAESPESNDLLGLENLFHSDPAPVSGNIASQLTEDQIEKIADRVIRKISTQVIEGIAWDVVPEIATKILRDELKKTNS